MVFLGRRSTEALLNIFVRSIALLERMGNALGTLAFVWATVVVLGGFSDHLGDDFWVVATIIVFLEAFRAFSRQSRSDDKLLFKTKGGINLKRVEIGTGSRSLYYTNAVIMPLCIWDTALNIIQHHLPTPRIPAYDAFVALLVLEIVKKLGFYKFIGYVSKKECHILLQLSPAASILLLGIEGYFLQGLESFPWETYFLVPLWLMAYILASLGSPRDHAGQSDGDLELAQVLRPMLLLVTTLVLLLMLHEPLGLAILLGPLLLGNLQTPMALVQIFLSCGGLFWSDIQVYDARNGNVKLAVKLLYIMVLCQGVLYMAACILESFSFLPRRSLALCCGLVDKMGKESVDLYYEQAYDIFLQENLFDSTTKKMSLVTFAVDSLSPDAPWEKKRAAVRILDFFLQQHETASSSNTELISLITTSTKAVTTLISMLGWTIPKDADIRMFAAKVTIQLAPYLRIIGIPGTMQMVSSLLDAEDKPMTEDISAPVVDGKGGNANDQQIRNGSNSPLDIEGGHTPGRQAAKFCLLEWISIFFRHVKEMRSIPWEDSKDRDSLPVLGMQILEGLAHDLHNCREISRATDILPKVIGYISCITGTTSTKQEKIEMSSFTLVAKLASIEGKIGITLRQELSENPFLIGNLAEILVLEGSSNYLQQSDLAMGIIAKLTMDKKTRQMIGGIQAIIDKLMQEFLGCEESPKPLRAVAGEALAMLVMESPANCSAMLMDEPTYKLIGDLTKKLQRGEHIYIAASLLQSICENCSQVLPNQGQGDHLMLTFPLVLERIMDAEGKELEALVGLATQICSVMSQRINPILQSFQDDKRLAEKLVGELNTHKKPTLNEFPNIRKLLVGLIVSVVDFCPRYAPIFREHGMVEALSNIEQYMVFFGSMVVVSKELRTLPALVARAKLLIGANTASV